MNNQIRPSDLYQHNAFVAAMEKGRKSEFLSCYMRSIDL